MGVHAVAGTFAVLGHGRLPICRAASLAAPPHLPRRTSRTASTPMAAAMAPHMAA
jgi:hypothetical protein